MKKIVSLAICISLMICCLSGCKKDSKSGDVNADGKLTAADLVMLQNWLVQSGSINNGRLGDLDGNGILNGIDLSMLRSMLIH